jgi:hypothetical protein
MTYLAEKGHDVTGVEFIDDAIEQYFEGKAVTRTATDRGGEQITSTLIPCEEQGKSKQVSIVKADFFKWGEHTRTQFDNVYDRGSFVGAEHRMHRFDILRRKEMEQGERGGRQPDG